MSGYGYCPWADDDETDLLEEMSGEDLKGILGSYKKMLGEGEFDESIPVPEETETPGEWADRTNPSALDLVLQNHPTLDPEKAQKMIDELG